MKISRRKSDGKFIEAQSHASDATFIANAIAAGYTEAEIEVIDCTQEEFAAIMAALPKSASQVRRDEFDTAINGDSNLAAFRAMSKADFDTWWSANVTNSTQAIIVLKKLAWIVVSRVL